MTEIWLDNKTFNEIQIGDEAHMVRQITRRDIDLFAVVSGDTNPSHIDEAYAKDDRFRGLVAHGLLGGALISAVLGTKLPGPGTVYLGQDLRFHNPVRPGDTIEVKVKVTSKDEAHHIVILDCFAHNQNGQDVITGTATVMAPMEKIRRPAITLPDVEMRERDRLRKLVDMAKKLPPLRTAVVHPCDTVSLEGAASALAEGLIIPLLIGPESKIRAAAEACGIDLTGYEIDDVPHSHAAAMRSVELVRKGSVAALMKGSLHTDELMSAVVGRDSGMRTERRMSHVFVKDVPLYKWPLLITDAALNVSPTLRDKADICQNAIHLAHDIGIEDPRVAILAATETVSENMVATLDAASLCKMSDRKQITGGTLDGPLAFDNAINAEAARIKGISSPVAGQADILLVPNIESGNMLVKQLDYFAAADSAGVVCGSRVPIILTSRADHAPSRMASAALAVLAAEGDRKRREAKAISGK